MPLLLVLLVLLVLLFLLLLLVVLLLVVLLALAADVGSWVAALGCSWLAPKCAPGRQNRQQILLEPFAAGSFDSAKATTKTHMQP